MCSTAQRTTRAARLSTTCGASSPAMTNGGSTTMWKRAAMPARSRRLRMPAMAAWYRGSSRDSRSRPGAIAVNWVDGSTVWRRRPLHEQFSTAASAATAPTVTADLPSVIAGAHPPFPATTASFCITRRRGVVSRLSILGVGVDHIDQWPPPAALITQQPEWASTHSGCGIATRNGCRPPGGNRCGQRVRKRSARAHAPMR
jgi:hypothetical protein